MEKLALGPFSRGRLERALSSFARAVGPEPAGYIDDVAVSECLANRTNGLRDVVVSGWAMDPFSQHPVASVLVIVEGQVMGRATTGQQRPDVAKALGQNGLARSGRTYRFGFFRLAPGPHRVEAYALLNDGRHIVRLGGVSSDQG